MIGHFFEATSSFVHYFKAISEFKLELQSGNIQFRSNLAIFCPMWPWKLTDDLEKQQDTFSATSSFVICASFRSHRSIQTGVIVWKRPIWGKKKVKKWKGVTDRWTEPFIDLLGRRGEWLNLGVFLGTADNEVHIVHISHVIIDYTLESLSFLT